MTLDEYADLLAEQDGVVSRRQLLAAGARAHDIQRWRRRRELTVVTSGVYVAHTGPLTWRQRAWAAVLATAPSALWGESALCWHEERDGSPEEAVQVALHRHRHLDPPRGVRAHRRVRLEDRVLWERRPPVQRYDDAVVEVALAASAETDTLEVLARAIRGRRTTAMRLRSVVAGRPGRPRRDWVLRVLLDLAAGACSVLEHGYLDRVEQSHGLPSSRRQTAGRSSAGVVYRDTEYDDGLLVELDGRLTHDTARQRDADFERDLDAAVGGQETRRLTYAQVFERPCSTAAKVGLLLAQRGWEGRVRSCGPGCLAPAIFEGGRLG